MEIFTNIYRKNNKDYVAENYGLINDGVRNHSIFSSENVSGLHSYVRSINGLLNDGKTRPSGVQQLVDFLPQCPKSIFSDYGERWMRYMTTILGGVGSGDVKIKACQVVSYILREVDGLADLQKAISSKQATAIVQTLASAGQEWGPAAFDTLTEYVCRFPGPSLSHKTSVEQQMIQYLDFPVGVADRLVCGAGKVYSALPIPGAGVGTAGRAEARGQQLTGLLALCHSLQDYLLEGFIEKESYNLPRSSELPLSPLNNNNETQDPTRTHLKAATRLINAFTFIDELISEKHNISISLVPYHLISPVIRILQVEGIVLSKYRSQEHQLLAFLLPSLHQAAVLLLTNMLISVGESLDAYWGILADVLAATLKSSNHIMTSTGQSHGQTQQASHTRVLCYHTLEVLTQVSHGRHPIPHNVVRSIIQDITPTGDSVTLKQTGTGTGGLASLTVKKKQRHRNKKAGYTVTSDTTNGKDGNKSSIQCPEAHESVVSSALKLASTLFLCSGHSMKYKSIQALQSCVLIVSQWLSSHWWVQGVYRIPNTRALLYSALSTLALHPNPRYPPPYTQILNTMQQATSSSDNLQVLEVCRSGIASLSFILTNPQVFAYEEAVRKVKLNNDIHKESSDDESEKEEEIEEEDDSEDEVIQEVIVQENEKERNMSENDEQTLDHIKELDSINDVNNKETDGSDHKDSDTESEDNMEEENEASQEGNASSLRSPDSNKKLLEDIDPDDKTTKISQLSTTSENKSPDTTSNKRSLDDGKVSPSKKKTNKKAVDNSGISVEEMMASFVDADPDD